MPHPARPVPTTNDEVFEHYYPYILKLVRKAGFAPQNVEDVAMRLMMKFIERDGLATFDPDYTTAHGGVVRKTSFDTFISGFVYAHIRYLREREAIETYREPTYIDETVVVGGSETDHKWTDVHGLYHEDTHEELELADLVARVHVQIDAMGSKHSCDFNEFFDTVQEQVQATGKINIAILATKYGVSKTAVQNWMKQLRAQVALALAE